jgi:hypothetical protein
MFHGRKEEPLKVEDISFEEITTRDIKKDTFKPSFDQDNINAVTLKVQLADDLEIEECKLFDFKVNGVKGETIEVIDVDNSSIGEIHIREETKGVRSEINSDKCGSSMSTSTMVDKPAIMRASMEKDKALPDLKINNFTPRIDVEQISILDVSKETTGLQQTPKPQLLKTDYVAWVGVFSLTLTIVTIFVNSKNDNIIKMNGIISNIFFIVMPTYWILRSEEKTKFVQRRATRFMNKYRI